MDVETELMEITQNGGFAEIRLAKTKTVRELLKELGLLHRHFVVLVDGKRAEFSEEIKEGQSVIVLPVIAGG
ncbi:MAG: MoaD/ThiS family protein [Candidatus Hodarchaeota archaeon]